MVENHLQNYNLESQSPIEISMNITKVFKCGAKKTLPPLIN